jgi:hypothetical protein
MPFSSFKNLKSKQLAEGVAIKAVSGDKMTMTFFSFKTAIR